MADKNDFLTYGLIILVAGLALGYITFTPTPGAITAEEGVVIEGEPIVPTGGTQVTITNTTAALVAKDAFTNAQVVVESAALRGGTVIDDANTSNSVTVNPGEVLTLYFGNDGQTTGIDQSTSIGLSGSTNYYCPILEDAVMANDAGELVPNLTVTASCYAEGAFSNWTTVEGQRNSTSAPWDLGSTTTTDEGCAELTIEAPINASYGNPYSPKNLVAVFDVNTDAFQNVWIEGAENENYSIPGTYRTTGDFASLLNVNSIQNKDKLILTVCAKTVSGIDLETAGTATDSDINIALMDPTSYFDEEGRGLVWGVEDEEDNSAIGYAETMADIVIYMDTAAR